MEAVCDCGTSVSCLSPLIYDELKQTHKLDPKPCLRKLRAANRLPIEVKSVVGVPKSLDRNYMSMISAFSTNLKRIVCSA